VLPLDEMTRRNLELVEPLRAGAEGATLLDVIDRTLTPMGGRLLRRWLLAPLVDPARSMRGSTRCRCSSAMAGAASGCARRSMVCATLNAWQDARRWAAPTARDGRVAGLDPAAPRCRGALSGLEGDIVVPSLDLLTDIGEELGRALVERPPAQLDDGDTIKPGYDRDLDELTAARDGGKQYIAALQSRERERTAFHRSRSDSTRSSAITSKSRTRTASGFRPTTSGARPSPARNAT